MGEIICEKSLKCNKSCFKAWEMLGFIFERRKRKSYEDAAACYKKSWELEFESSLMTGCKLAICYMNCGKFMDAIEICDILLQKHPQFSARLKEAIFDKCIIS